MRVTTILLLLAGLFVAPTAVAIVESGIFCGDPCFIQAREPLGFAPRLAILTTGTTVRWVSLDIPHSNAEGAGFGGAPGCLGITYSPATGPGQVRFDIVTAGGQTGLLATKNPGTGFEQTKRCTGAIRMPDGAWTLPYHCVIHPATMQAALEVREVA